MHSEYDMNNYLDNIVGKALFKKEKKELINTVRVKDNRGRIQKSYTHINNYFSENNIGYLIHAKRTSNKRYWEVIYNISFEDYLKKFSTVHEVKYLLHKMSLKIK
ncbi:hypothetical protein [Salipaludibacillus sp. CF4.18]|uniref:hypothetical protein n=1 Tax=Salipaludibacillus sp. CF4.18 TaxID=3373081 RepID=UPI003EE68C03